MSKREWRISLAWICRICLYWIFLFTAARAIFLVYNWSKVKEESLLHITRAFFHGLYIDFSAIAYIFILLFPLMLAALFSGKKIIFRFIHIISACITLLAFIIVFAELKLYDEWGIKMHYKALTYLRQPTEILQTAGTSTIVFSLAGIGICTFLSMYVAIRYWQTIEKNIQANWHIPLVMLLVCPPMLILALRGGTQQIPIQLSDVYYSHNNTLNNTAINSLWNIGHSIRENASYLDTNPYMTTSAEEAKTFVQSLFQTPPDTGLHILQVPKPNIVFCILEGWSADLIASLGGYQHVTPNLDSLAAQGILFSGIYASGDRSDQGIAALLSGFPAQPTTSIISQPAKYKQLPSLVQALQALGYSSSFVFGGQLTYGNIKSYVIDNGFGQYTEGKDFPYALHKSKLGVPDEYMYARKLQVTNTLREPFFSVSFNLSSHAPYDIPRPYMHNWGENENGYVNSVWYADSCLGVFMQEAKKQSWYKHTLFVFISDHSHNSPRNHNFYSPAYRHIPFVLFGPAIAPEYRGKRIEKIGSQTDVAYTLLKQLHVHAPEYSFSKDLLHPQTKDFAFYAIVDGLGWIKPEGHVVYDFPLKRYYENTFPDSMNKASVKEGKMFLQHVFQTYLDY